MIKFIICDDNTEALNVATNTITKIMMNHELEYKIYKFVKYNKELKSLIKDPNDIKIYILDIEMPVVSGLEIGSEIREIDDDSQIIFVTAHSECKDDIFYSRLKAIDFISKYLKYEERLGSTIEHIIKKLYKNKTLDFNYNYNFYRIFYKEITYIEKSPSQNKCIIHLLNGDEKFISTTIIKLKEELGDMFYQTHKSCIVNISNIRNIDFAKFTIYFKNGESTDLLALPARKGLRKHVGIH